MELDLEQRRRMREDGYVVLPGVVPRPLIVEALRDINHRLGLGRSPSMGTDAYADARDYWSEDTDDPAIMDLLFKSPLWELAESPLGGAGALLRPPVGQIALRFPSINNSHGGPASHIDGFYSPNAPKPISRFTMLAGVLLSDTPDKYMGNLAVYPGTHRQIAEYIKANGTQSLRAGLGRKIDLPEAVQITGKAGDAVLCHYQLAHDKEQNLSHMIRYMAYWRLWHKNAEECQSEGLTDIWREWPAIAALEKTKNAPRKTKG
jgi:hypothetical protein